MSERSITSEYLPDLEIARMMDSLGKLMTHIESMPKDAPIATKATQRPLNLRLELKNFGPVARGTVRLGPLTIFIGPNNSGKSYVSILAHSIMSAYQSDPIRLGQLDISSTIGDMLHATNGKPPAMPPTMINKLRDKMLQSFGTAVKETLLYNFKSEPHMLVRRGADSASVTISEGDAINDAINLTIGKTVTAKLCTPSKVMVKMVDSITEKPMQKTKTGIVINMTEHMKKILPYYVWMHMWNAILPQRPVTHYLPATRSGIIQAYKTLAANLMSTKPGPGTFPTNSLAGTIADLASYMINLPEGEGGLEKIGRQMEKDLLDGSIILPPPNDPFNEIMYFSKGHHMPLRLASSTVSEVAPISISLRRIAEPGQLLIIEEPEAHLHQKNQAKIASSIVRMIRAGLNVLITTHSPYLVSRLGQYLMAGMADPKSRAKLGYKDEYLLYDEVYPYVFSKTNGGYRIQEVEKDGEVGISQEAFIQVLDELHEESIKLYDKL